MGMIYFPVTDVLGYATQPIQSMATGNPNSDFILAFIAIPLIVVMVIFAASWYKNKPRGPKQIEYAPREPEPKQAPGQAKPAGVV